jgi:hypothetical protein
MPQRHPLSTELAVLHAAAPADLRMPQQCPRWAVLLLHVLFAIKHQLVQQDR